MKLPNDELTWSEVISRTLMDLARKDKILLRSRQPWHKAVNC